MKIVKFPSRPLAGGLLIVLFAGVISCTDKPDLTANIPKEASVVMTFDVKSMALKSLDFKHLFNIDNIKKAIGKIGEKKDSTAVSIKDSGLDLATKAYLFARTSEDNRYGAILAVLSDAKEFEEFLKKSDNSITVSEEGKIKIATLPAEESLVAWNDKIVVMVFGSDKPKEVALSVLNLDPHETLISVNESFKESQKTKADISFWLNLEAVSKMVPEYSASMSSVNLKETYVTATCNFEDGQVVVDSKYTLNAETAEKYNFVRANVNNEVVGVIPGKSIIGLIGVALDMVKIYDHLEKAKLLEAYGPMITQTTGGLTAKDVFDMLNGDIVLLVNGFQMKESLDVDTEGKLITRKTPDPLYCAVIGIANKATLDKLLEQLSKTGMLTKKEALDPYYTVQNQIFFGEKGSTLVFTKTEDMLKSILSGQADKLDAEVSGMLSANASSIYINLPNIPDEAYSGGDEKMPDKIRLSEVQVVTITAATKENVSTARMVIRFKEKGENSLITIGRVSREFSDMLNEPTEPAPVLVGDSTVVQ